MQDNRLDTLAQVIQLKKRQSLAAQPMLAMPLGLLAQLTHGARAEFVPGKPTGGFGKLDVNSNGECVATFAVPPLVGQAVPSKQLSAANDPTMPSAPGNGEQWWDDEMLNEPLEPLPEFE